MRFYLKLRKITSIIFVCYYVEFESNKKNLNNLFFIYENLFFIYFTCKNLSYNNFINKETLEVLDLQHLFT
jgi:hypothetical protein